MPHQSKLKKALSHQLAQENQITVRFSYFDPEMENIVLSLISQSLASCQLGYIENVVFTVFREVINNAQKANLKRVFFQKRNVDLSVAETYAGLMEEFKQNAVMRILDYKKDMENSEFWMEFSLQIKDDQIHIQVCNNVEMTHEEWSRVNERIGKASEIDNLEDAFDSLGDDMEGEGIGIALNLVLLKSVGISPKKFEIISENGETKARFSIPARIQKQETVEIIRQLILNEVRAIPSYPEMVQSILKSCTNSHSNLEDISSLIESDTGLATEVLRSAVQSGVIPTKEVVTIHKAVQILGVKGIFEVVSAIASRNILSQRFTAFDIFWESSQMCSSYVRSIVQVLKLKDISDVVYLAALFHDIGRILLYSLRPEELQKLDNLSLDLNQPGPSTLEEIHLGIPHTVIGSMIAVNWGYSEDISEIILNYHRPLFSPPHLQRETALVYLSQALVSKGTIQDRTGLLDLNALELLGIGSLKELDSLHSKLKSDFDSFLERTRLNTATASL